VSRQRGWWAAPWWAKGCGLTLVLPPCLPAPQVLGLVPSIVKAWRSSGCMRGLDWSSIR
jgi:hypothetical protein